MAPIGHVDSADRQTGSRENSAVVSLAFEFELEFDSEFED